MRHGTRWKFPLVPLSEYPLVQEVQDVDRQRNWFCSGVGGVYVHIRSLSVAPFHWHLCAETSSDPLIPEA